ncbi:YraN family protein [Marimonas lutisalis]|uniref:YraN family protein n=1 Tax=Marimonas lutisalis TaxID=2545756 RepID=UPI0010F45F8A|nr:YraN family protein [Marimonas lutisalis]
MTAIPETGCADGAPVSARRRRGLRAHLAGAEAEAQVARHYEDRGLSVAHHRWRGRGGEIDLVLRDGAALVFVEVKRATVHAQAADSVSATQAARICAAAQEYLAGEPAGELTEMRIDVALVDRQGAVEIIENALGQF